MLTLRDVYFAYPERKVLHGVSLEPRPGRVLGLLGPNGAGKSTLVRLAAGLLRPQRGQVLLEGRDLRDWSRREVAGRVSVLPQDGVLPAAFTAREVAMLGRTPHLGWLAREGPRDRAVVARALDLADATAIAERPVDELSGGERQRVLLARALAQEPSVLLLDEPTVHLDLGHQVALLDLVVRLAREGGLVVLAVFHDLNLAAQSCDDLALLSQGRLVAAGPPDDVLRSPVVREVFGVDLVSLPHPTSGRTVVLLPEIGP